MDRLAISLKKLAWGIASLAVLAFVYWCATDHSRKVTAAGTWVIFFLGVWAWAHFSTEAEKYKNWLKPEYKEFRERTAAKFGEEAAPEMFAEYDGLTSSADKSPDA